MESTPRAQALLTGDPTPHQSRPPQEGPPLLLCADTHRGDWAAAATTVAVGDLKPLKGRGRRCHGERLAPAALPFVRLRAPPPHYDIVGQGPSILALLLQPLYGFLFACLHHMRLASP